MRTNYPTVITLTFASLHVNAQLTLTKAANEPVSGDIVKMVRYDTTSAVPKNTGANQAWNFSTLTNASSFTETTTYTTVASTPGASLFPAATLAASRGSDFEYFKSGGSTWEFLGNFSSSDILNLTNSGIFSVWPVSFGSSNTDVASGMQSNSSNTAAVNATLTYVAAGTGTVTLPGGNMHTNCLQIVETLTVVIGTGTSAVTLDQRTYRYYSSSKKFPIVELQYSTNTTGTVVSKDFEIYVDNATTIVGLDRTSHLSGELSVFPVPADDVLHFELPGGACPDLVEVFDLHGKVVLREQGTAHVKVAELAGGYYLAKVYAGERVYQKGFTVLGR